MNKANMFPNLFDIVAITATGIAAPVIGADDILDGDTGSDEQPPEPELNPTNDDQQNF